MWRCTRALGGSSSYAEHLGVALLDALASDPRTLGTRILVAVRKGSMGFRIRNRAVYATIEEAKAGKFEGGPRRFGLANKGVDYSYDEFNAKVLTESVRKQADAIKQEIISGKITVPDYYRR